MADEIHPKPGPGEPFGWMFDEWLRESEQPAPRDSVASLSGDGSAVLNLSTSGSVSPSDLTLAQRHAAITNRLRLECRVARGDESALEPAARAALQEQGEPSPDDDLLDFAKSQLRLLLRPPWGDPEAETRAVDRERILEAVEASGGLLVQADGAATAVVHGNAQDAGTVAVVRSHLDARYSVDEMCRHGADISDDAMAVMTIMGYEITGPLDHVYRCGPEEWARRRDKARDQLVEMIAGVNPTARLIVLDDIEPSKPEITRQRITDTNPTTREVQNGERSQPQAARRAATHTNTRSPGGRRF